MRFFASASGSPLDRKFEAWKWSSAFSQASRCSTVVRPAALLGVEHDLGVGVHLVAVRADELAHVGFLLARAGDGVLVDGAQLGALAGTHLEEGLFQTLREPLLLGLQVEQALGVEPLDVGLHGPRAHVRRHHVDADVLLEQQCREVAEVAAGELGMGRRGGPGREQEREQQPGPTYEKAWRGRISARIGAE